MYRVMASPSSLLRCAVNISASAAGCLIFPAASFRRDHMGGVEMGIVAWGPVPRPEKAVSFSDGHGSEERRTLSFTIFLVLKRGDARLERDFASGPQLRRNDRTLQPFPFPKQGCEFYSAGTGPWPSQGRTAPARRSGRSFVVLVKQEKARHVLPHGSS